jgi:DNA-directed RNA polymerase specialized sigma24 family protein
MSEREGITEVASSMPRDFRTTHWSVVLEASGSSDDAKSALERLCRQYWHPLYGFVRRRGHDEHQAQDLTQEFFASFLAANSLQTVSPDRGRFRTFLLAALKNFLANDWRDSNRQKRGGGKQFIPLDEFLTEEGGHMFSAETIEPEVLYDRRWAQMLVTTSLGRLESEMGRDGLEERFRTLKQFCKGMERPARMPRQPEGSSCQKRRRNRPFFA